MDALKYLEDKKKICESVGGYCTICPLFKARHIQCSEMEEKDPEAIISQVEDYVNRPKNTNGSEILKALPESVEFYTDSETMKAVVIKVPLVWWNEPIEGEAK